MILLYYSMSSSKWETLLGGCSNPFKKIWKKVLTNWKGCRIIIHAPSKTDARYANVAHLVERHLAKVEVASSSLVVRSKSCGFKDPQLFLHFGFACGPSGCRCAAGLPEKAGILKDWIAEHAKMSDSGAEAVDFFRRRWYHSKTCRSFRCCAENSGKA